MDKEESKVKIVKNARVEATEKGWDNFKLRKVGDVFNYSGPLGSWMKVLPKIKKGK